MGSSSITYYKPELVQELLKQGAVKNLCDNLPETKTLTPIEKEISEFHVINNEEPSTITKHRNFILSIIDGYRGQK